VGVAENSGGCGLKWFKHDANAVLDSKLKRLRTKYGLEGYGLYWYCLECVARNVERHNLTFELEEDAELISSDTGIHRERVEEMMRDMVNWGLFEESQGRITCLKMATRTDEYTKKLISKAPIVGIVSGQTPDSVGIKSELIEEKRREEKRKTSRSRFTPPTIQEVTEYCESKGYTFDPEAFVAYHQTRAWKLKGGQTMKCWKSACTTFQKNENKWNPKPEGVRYV